MDERNLSNIERSMMYYGNPKEENVKVKQPELQNDFVNAMQMDPKFQELMMMYRCAIREVQTKMEVLNDEFQTRRKRNPIDTIRSRIKSPSSIYEKLERRGFEKSLSSIMNNLNDVAGVRVVCPFISDIYLKCQKSYFSILKFVFVVIPFVKLPS